MSTAEIQVNIQTLQAIPIALCHPNPANKMRPVTAEFRESIREMGQRVPALLRPHPDIAGAFDVVYGARRLEALEDLGKLYLRAEVREMSDEEARLERAIENENREPLSWQQKAEMVMECLAAGSTAETIGRALGCSPHQVRRTGQLLKLSGSWRRLVNERSMPNWGPGHFEPFAYLSEEAQEELYQEFPVGMSTDWTAKEVEKWVAERSMLLKLAPWDLEDVTLQPAAGSCTGCGERSSANPDLFAEASGIKHHDRCLNAPCWARKSAVWLNRAYAKAVEKHGRVVKISKEYVQTGDELPPGHWEAAKKADDGAVAALVVRGTGLGKVEWVTLPGTKKASRKPVVEEAAEGPAVAEESEKRGPGRPVESEEQKRSRHEKRRWSMAIEMLMEQIDLDRYPVEFPTTQVVAMAVAFGVQSTANNGEPWKALERMVAWEKADLRAALLAQVKKAVVLRLVSAEDPVAEGRRAAGLFGLDLDSYKAEADKEIPDPAAWGKTFEAGAHKEHEETNAEAWAKVETPAPELLFNSPQKQAAFLFLKDHPGQDFEAFQVVTGRMDVSRAQFWQVEEAIEAQAEKLKQGAGK